MHRIRTVLLRLFPVGVRWWVALELIALCMFVVTRAAHYERHVDFHMEDEVGLMASGRDLWRHGALPHLAWAPLSAVVYALVTALSPASWSALDVMYWLVVVAASGSLWWMLRPLVPSPIRLLLAAWFGSAAYLLEAQCRGGMAIPHVYAANAAILFLALGTCARGRPRLALLALALAAVNRFEYAPWVLAFGLALAAWRGSGWSPRVRLALAFSACIPMALAMVSADVQGRSWMAFTQNYAFTAVADDLRRADPSVGPDQVRRAQLQAYAAPGPRIAVDFPTAPTVLAAMQENPRRFFGHVLRTLAAVPGMLVRAQGTTLLSRGGVGALLAGLALVAAVGWLRCWRVGGPGAQWPAPLWMALLTSPCAVTVPLFVADRGELFWPLFPTWSLCTVAGASAAVRWCRPAASWPAFCGPALSIGLIAIALLVPGPFAGPPSRLQHRHVVDLLTEQPPAAGARVVVPWPSYGLLLDRPDLELLVPGRFDQPKFEAFLTGRPGDTIVLCPDLQGQVPDYRAIVDWLASSPRWRETARRDDVVVYVRLP